MVLLLLVIIMARKFSIVNCTTNYLTSTSEEKLHVYMFPRDTQKLQYWLSSIPNAFEKVTSNMGVCEKHWPPDCKMHKPPQSKFEVSILKVVFIDIFYND